MGSRGKRKAFMAVVLSALLHAIVVPSANAAPSFIMSGSSSPGETFTLIWVDDEIDRSVGLTDFDVAIGWDPNVFELTGVVPGSLFGDALAVETFSFDVFGDGSVLHPGFTFTRVDPVYDGGTVVRNDVAYLTFNVIARVAGLTSSIDLIPSPLPGGPYDGYYYFSPGGTDGLEGVSTGVTIVPAAVGVPEPVSLSLALAALAAVGAARRTASR